MRWVFSHLEEGEIGQGSFFMLQESSVHFVFVFVFAKWFLKNVHIYSLVFSETAYSTLLSHIYLSFSWPFYSWFGGFGPYFQQFLLSFKREFWCSRALRAQSLYYIMIPLHLPTNWITLLAVFSNWPVLSSGLVVLRFLCSQDCKKPSCLPFASSPTDKGTNQVF